MKSEEQNIEKKIVKNMFENIVKSIVELKERGLKCARNICNDENIQICKVHKRVKMRK